jgi:Fe2+ transport system protein FeoA
MEGTVDLASAKQGTVVKVVGFERSGSLGGRGQGYRGRGNGGCGRGFLETLRVLGITEGDELLVLRSAPFHGPVLVEVKRLGTKVALGRGMAQKIEVMPVDEEASLQQSGDPKV